MEWYDRVDFVDPFFGSPEELNALLESAPTPELRTWLAEQIERNKAFEAQLAAGSA